MAKRKRGTRLKRKHPMGRDEIRELLLSAVKNASSDLLDAAVAIARDAEDPGGDLAWLAAYDFDEDVATVAVMVMALGMDHPDMSDESALRMSDTAEIALLDAMKNPALCDDRKFPLVAPLGLCHGEMTEHELRGYFKDYDGASDRYRDQVAQTITGGSKNIHTVLGSMGLLDDDPDLISFGACLEICGEAAGEQPEAAALLLGVTVALSAELDEPWLYSTRALEMIAQTKCGRGAWALAELSRMPGMGELSAKAAELARDSLLEGIKPDPPAAFRFINADITSADSSGSRVLTITFETPEETPAAIVALISDGDGLEGFTPLFDDDANLRDYLPDLSKSKDAILAPCSFETAREVIADAMAVNVEFDIPLPGLFFLASHWLGEAILPMHREPDLSGYEFDKLDHAKLLAESRVLVKNITPYRLVRLVTEETFDYVAGSELRTAKKLTKKRLAAFADRIDDDCRDLLMSRLAICLETARMAGRGSDRQTLVAAAVYNAIATGSTPFEKLPYVEELSRDAIRTINTHLNMGLSSPADVIRAMNMFDAALDGADIDDFDDMLDDDM